MGFSLYRLDAFYNAALVPAAVELLGSGLPDSLKAMYKAFVDRYPAIGPEAFKTTNPNSLAEVGIVITPIPNKLEITFRVDQITANAVNLTVEETRLAQDCAMLAANTAGRFSESSLGACTMRLSTWLKVDGGLPTVDALLAQTSEPKDRRFQPRWMGAEQIRYTPRLDLVNISEGWRLNVSAEPSAIPGADLFLSRNYSFESGGRLGSVEQQIAFMDHSMTVLVEWLGIGPYEA